jgi:hypothetical protein
VFKLSVSTVTPADATLTVSPGDASFGSTLISTYREKTFEVRAKASKKSPVSPVVLENFSIKPGNSQYYYIDPGATNCVQGKPLASESGCKIAVVYWPQAETSKGQFDTAALELTTNSEETKPAASSGVIDVMLKGQCRLFHPKR